jgi:hypothetical protein
VMIFGQQLRLRLVMALCAVLWSSHPAFAAFACAHTPDCPQHAAHLQQRLPSQYLISDSKPCCPMHTQSPSKGAGDVAGCCAWGDANSRLVPNSFAPKHSRARQALAELRSELFRLALQTGHSPLFRLETALFHIKPVDQKKTDLRI